MDLSVYKVEEIKKILSPVFKQNGVKSAILFGSYAKGNARVKSDIDLCVDSGLIGLDFLGLIEYIHIALKKKVDVFDVRSIIKGSEIEQEIKKYGIKIYGW